MLLFCSTGETKTPKAAAAAAKEGKESKEAAKPMDEAADEDIGALHLHTAFCLRAKLHAFCCALFLQ